ncbi:MAG: VOC family protein [Pseudomonadota bacterium]|nr:VOC family protein [Pseudomonadota bacterium]
MPNDLHVPRAQYPRFHLAFPVTDLGEARRFYGDFLECTEGRSADEWVDFDFFGHQIVAHKIEATGDGPSPAVGTGEPTSFVDGHQVPVRHFGVILDMSAWEALSERLLSGGVRFIIAPHVRFKGLPGEQATMFFLDPFGNALEFKAFADINRLFMKNA